MYDGKCDRAADRILEKRSHLIRKMCPGNRADRMQEGMTLTEACMAAGFATPSHMADTSQNLLGLSMSYVKEIVSGSYDTLDHKTADRQKYPADLL